MEKYTEPTKQSYFVKGYKAIQINIPKGKINGVPEFLYYLWGADVFAGNIPILKTLIVANVAVWIIFIF